MSFSPVLGPRQPPRLIKMLISAHRLADIPVRLPAASRVSPPFPMCPCFPVSLSPFSSVSPRVPPWTRSLSRPSPLLSHFVPLSRHAAVVSFPIFPTPPPPGASRWGYVDEQWLSLLRGPRDIPLCLRRLREERSVPYGLHGTRVDRR